MIGPCVVVVGTQIADFGLSQLIRPGQKLNKVCGTWAYAAPEMADHHADGYDCKFDCWSYGVVLFVVLSGYHPFDPEGTATVPEVGRLWVTVAFRVFVRVCVLMRACVRTCTRFASQVQLCACRRVRGLVPARVSATV